LAVKIKADAKSWNKFPTNEPRGMRPESSDLDSHVLRPRIPSFAACVYRDDMGSVSLVTTYVDRGMGPMGAAALSMPS
jgi:hypothetical protein